MIPNSLLNEIVRRGYNHLQFIDLWKTQLEEWPDSIHLPAWFVLGALSEEVHSHQFLHSAAFALLGPGFFYACGKKDNGDYGWLGYRYGVEPQQYLSGFFCEVPARLVALLEE